MTTADQAATSTAPPPFAAIQAALTAQGQPFEMATRQIDGRPVRTWLNAPTTLRAVLELSRVWSERTFFVYEDERMTFSEHFRLAATLARRLVERYGVQAGDRVAIAARNLPEWSVAFWAAAAAGAVIVPLNAWWTAPELLYGLTDSGSKVAFLDEERAARLGVDLANLPLDAIILRAPSGAAPEGTEALVDVIGADPTDELPDVAIDPEDNATIFYTSGTTGRPKGALGSQRNICTNLFNLQYAAAVTLARSGGEPPDPTQQRSGLLSVPFFHATGCHSVLVANTAIGGKIVLMYKWNPERALELIERERVQQFGGVPTMAWQVLTSPDFAKRDTSSLTNVAYGGAPAPPELVRRISELLPGRVPSNGYGLTETSSLTTSNGGYDYVRKPDSVGRPMAVCDVRVVDVDGSVLPVGEIGELHIYGPNVVRGYWGRPDATAEVFVDGWLHTGDVARLDDEGFVYIVDRAKDMLIRGGENVYCVEVESALYEHPAVRDAAVIGIPDRVLGEEVGAVVELQPGASATQEDLQAHVAARLAAFKVPSRIWFSDTELPRNPAGKLLKRTIREQVLPAR